MTFPVRRARLLGVGTAIAVLVGGSYGVQRVILRVVRDQPAAVFPTIATQLVPWLVWVLLLPALARFCTRVPLTAVARYAGAGALAAVVHTALAVVPIGMISGWTTVNLPLPVGYQQLLLNRGVVVLTEFALIVIALHAVLYHARSAIEATARQALER